MAGTGSKTSQTYLERPKCLGGLALPNFQYYYWATNLHVMHYWLQAADSEHIAAWLSIEAASCKPSSLPALLYSPGNSSTVQYTKNTIVKSTLKIWRQFKNNFGIPPSLLHAPIEQNH